MFILDQTGATSEHRILFVYLAAKGIPRRPLRRQNERSGSGSHQEERWIGLRMMVDPCRIADRLRTLDDLKSLIDSLPAAMRAHVITEIKFVLAEMRQQLSKDSRPQFSSAQARTSDGALGAT